MEYDTDNDDEWEDTFNTLALDVKGSEDDELTEYTTYITSYSEINSNNAVLTVTELANRACRHALTYDNEASSIEDNDLFTYTSVTILRYTSTKFIGVIIDTGASQRSIAGYGQYLALKHNIPIVHLNESTKGTVNVQFGIGSTSLIGSVTVLTPIGDVDFHVVRVDTLFLLCLADLDRLQVYYNNITNSLVTPSKSILVVRRFGHPFIL